VNFSRLIEIAQTIPLQLITFFAALRRIFATNFPASWRILSPNQLVPLKNSEHHPRAIFEIANVIAITKIIQC
jgi:hypothetical protein